MHHCSKALDALNRKQTVLRESMLKEAVEWCQNNQCRGYAAIKSGHFPLIKDARTINKRLDGKIITGHEKENLYNSLSDLNKESFMHILANIWNNRLNFQII